MALDFLRALRNPASLEVLLEDLTTKVRLAGDANAALRKSCVRVKQEAKQLASFIANHQDLVPVAARDLAWSVSQLYVAGLLLEHAAAPAASQLAAVTADRWCNKGLVRLAPEEYQLDSTNADLAMEGYDPQEVYGPMY